MILTLSKVLIKFMRRCLRLQRQQLVYLDAIHQRSIHMAETIDTLTAKVAALATAEAALAAAGAAHQAAGVATQAQLDALGATIQTVTDKTVADTAALGTPA